MKNFYFNLKAAAMSLMALTFASCNIYNSVPSVPLQINDIYLGMSKDEVIKKYGQPFTFSLRLSGKDTITVLSYKTPKAVANRGYIVTSKLSFNRNKLYEISQKDFYVPDHVVFSDTTKTD